MLLKMLHVEAERHFEIVRKFEFMTTMTMLVKIDCYPREQSFYYWALEPKPKGMFLEKLPFEISFYRDKSILGYVHFYLQDKELIFEKPLDTYPKIRFSGRPFFDISMYNDREFTFSDEGFMDAYYYDNTICLINKEQTYTYCVELNSSNLLIFDDNDSVSGVIMKNITEKEKKVLKECELL